MPVVINGTTGISGVDGSAGTPAFQGSDSNTGIRFGTDIVSLVTGGSDRLYIDSSGRLGVGTNSPGDLVTISDSTTPKLGLRTGTTQRGEFRATSAITSLVSHNSSPMSFIINDGTDKTAIHIDASQRVGIGSNSPGTNTSNNANQLVIGDNTNAAERGLTIGSTTGGGIRFNDGADAGVVEYSHASNFMRFVVNATEAARFDSSARLLVGTSSAQGDFTLQIQGDAASAAAAGSIYLRRGLTTAQIGGNVGADLGSIDFGANDGTIAGRIECLADATWSSTSDTPGRLVFSTTADGASSPTERMRITNLGEVQFKSNGLAGYSQRLFSNNGSQDLLFIEEYGTGSPSATAAILRLTKHTTNNRSINATGTINASGADYAEYMVKCGDFDIAKGDVCGVTSNGLLTLSYANSVSYVVKSTNPSYVGGDTWSQDARPVNKDGDEYGADTEEYKSWFESHEFARAKVDRIAFAGQVPVNVLGATPGQYIVPVEAADGGIEGIAKDEADLTLVEYMRAVGKVIAIEDDGRARIIVKVA